MKIHPIATVNVPGHQGETLNLLFGCSGHSCKGHCWLFNDIIPQLRRRGSRCLLCSLGEPHQHFERATKIPKKGTPRCYFQSCAEPNDFPTSDIRRLQEIIAANPRHIFQILSHFPEFWYKHAAWPDNTWKMTTFTSGEIYCPITGGNGPRVAYCEPVLGSLWLMKPGQRVQPDWMVIGLLNHQEYTVPLEAVADWIKALMKQAHDFRFPVFCKNVTDPRWAKMGIEPIQQFPKGW